MVSRNFDVIVVGAGAAGLTAAIGLVRSGLSVAVLEAAPFPGAENWSGCVYFCESLAHPDILGPEGVEELAWERRLVERGFFGTDGHGLLGMTYRDPNAFRHCYTVLRPIYDHHLAQVAVKFGVTLLNSTTVESLIREEERIIGVCTQRGALYADLVFLAEGDASHLVTREGYERFTDPRQTPSFLQGIKQVIELPPGAIEDRFGLKAQEGLAYEMLLRNGMLLGKPVHLNMGGFLYTNDRSLSIGLVLPADNLHGHFAGDPNLLMEWFENLPSLKPWFKEGKRGAFGAKIIRGGGAREIPTLVDHGLAVGGAASAVGIDFPYPNFTGPATAMGLQISHAARKIKEEGKSFSKENLRKYYLDPLQKHHYWKDVEFLRRWPGYVKKTKAFFGKNLDVTLQSAYLWTRSNEGLLRRWSNWLRLLLGQLQQIEVTELRSDFRQLSQALHLGSVFPRPALGQLFLDGCVNALRDIARHPRANLPEAGKVKLHYSVAGGNEPSGLPPALIRHWFSRFAPVLASAARLIYSNDEVSLGDKLPRALQLLVRQVNVVDMLTGLFVGIAAGASTAVMVGWERLRGKKKNLIGPPKPGSPEEEGPITRYNENAARSLDLTPHLQPASKHWEDRLAHLQYHSTKSSHIHIQWPQNLETKDELPEAGLWHVCPAKVYEARVSKEGQFQVVVNFENCIKCETCWRTSDLVDWGRDGDHRIVYAVYSQPVKKLLREMNQGELPLPKILHRDPWSKIQAEESNETISHPDLAKQLYSYCESLETKLQEFDEALGHEPRTIDPARSEYLEILARYSQQLAKRIMELMGEIPHFGKNGGPCEVLKQLGHSLVAKAEEGAKHTWNRRFSWAAADGRQLRFHHLVGIRRCLDKLFVLSPQENLSPNPWIRREETSLDKLSVWQEELDQLIPNTIWRDLEKQKPLSKEQDALLLRLLQDIPLVEADNLNTTLHPAQRKLLLAEIAQRDPSLAYRAAGHLWVRDLCSLANADFADQVTTGAEWSCLALPRTEADQAVYFVPAARSQKVLLLQDNQLALVPLGDKDSPLQVESSPSLGLRGAGLGTIPIPDSLQVDQVVEVDPLVLRKYWSIISSADLISIANGMAQLLETRAIRHATSRVQFPGLFHDEESRDTIGKFGAVKKMVAEIAARKYLIETLDWCLSPRDLSDETLEKSTLMKAIVAESLGCYPGSIAYNAGQIFGGTGFSEDDILSKYYRDAAAWRFLGPSNVEVFHGRGNQLLQNWRKEEEPLSCFVNEAHLFEEVAHRKALQAELDEIRVHRSQVRTLTSEWLATFDQESSPVSHEYQTELQETLGRQDAYLLAGKALLLRTHSRLEEGIPSETETSLLRVWLEATTEQILHFRSTVRRQLELAAQSDDRPIVDPEAGPAVEIYQEFLESPASYKSGDFLSNPFDQTRPRFVPEMIAIDPDLRKHDQQLIAEMQNQFAEPRQELSYERYLETKHRPDESDLEFCRQRGYFRYPIPKELGGEDCLKAEYYLLTTNLNRLADYSLSLTIQVNSSLGSTPVLVAREKELPKAIKDISEFSEDPTWQEKIQTQLKGIQEMIGGVDFSKIQKALDTCNKELKEKLKPTGIRVPAHQFLRTWQDANTACQNFNSFDLEAHLQKAINSWEMLCKRAPEYQDELQRRLKACDLFLQWISSGQISAFALTEPTAGSDTARVATRAHLKSAVVEKDNNGVLSFTPEGKQTLCAILDAAKIEFQWVENGTTREYLPFYRWSETEEPSQIYYDEYDYETDDPSKFRYYHHGEKKVYFTDIGRIREEDGKLCYDYWELNGAKMWITNGRMCGVLCLYAKTAEGVTGFMVDRHAEGLIVGRDEEKMGQCGSPTNEITLQQVRVPLENIIGLEGRGQVNALETLNVGRAGLAMSAMSQMAPLIDSCHKLVDTSNGSSSPAGCAWRFQKMEEIRFISEALSYHVIGLFEHKGTRSLRLESAIAKMQVSELFHELIELAEDIHQLPGQTQEHLVEKRKRDARVLNIYEGTNEIQRFFILRDLVNDVLARWPESPQLNKDGYMGQEALELENLKSALRKQTEAAHSIFGYQLWHNPNFQASCFFLSEAVAWLAAADSTLGRLVWYGRQENSADEKDYSNEIALGRRAFSRCFWEAKNRLSRFEEELTYLRRGFYAPEVRAASLLFREDHASEDKYPDQNPIPGLLNILVVLEPPIPGVPSPVVAEGSLQEPYRHFSEVDLSALETALKLRDASSGKCSIVVATVGPASTASLLRELSALDIDECHLIATDADAYVMEQGASDLVYILAKKSSFDLVLTGHTDSNSGSGLGILAGESLGIPYLGRADALTINWSDKQQQVALNSDGNPASRVLPGTISISQGLPLRNFTTAGFLQGAGKQVWIHPSSSNTKWEKPTLIPVEKGRRDTERTIPTTVLQSKEAGLFLRDFLGKDDSDSMTKATQEEIEISIEEVSSPSAHIKKLGTLSVVAAGSDGNLRSTALPIIRGGQFLAEVTGTSLGILAFVEEPESYLEVAKLLHSFGCSSVMLIPVEHGISESILKKVFLECWSHLDGDNQIVVGEPWANEVFLAMAAKNLTKNRVFPNVVDLEQLQGKIRLQISCLNGQARIQHLLSKDPYEDWWITLNEKATIAEVPGTPEKEPKVKVWKPNLTTFYSRQDIQQLLEEVKAATGIVRLADAEFILDVGFGVGNQDGYDAIITPLEKALRKIGVHNLVIGGSRKVTEELHLLPLDRQIGQSGVAVNPRLLLAVGVSGAPQHLNYIGDRTTILAFNRDPDAPIMTLNQRQPFPRVYPVLGDLFKTIPAFIQALDN